MRTGWDAYPFGGVLVLSLFAFFLPAPALPTGPPTSDKLEHAAIFFVLTVTGRYAGFAVSRLSVGLVAYAVASEVLQAVLPIRRHGDWHDVVADVVGIAAGMVLVLALQSVLERRAKPRR